MVDKKLLNFGIFFVLSFVIIGNVLALSCSIKDTCSPSEGNGIVMGLSSTSNAHGEVKDGGGNYPQFVCCDFEGTDTCTGSNGIGVFLSDTTNAHAELSGEGNYDTEICFGGMDCVTTTDSNCGNTSGYDLEIVSLSDTTNAHLGGFGEYGNKICCKWEANSYWADADDLGVVKTVAAVGDRVVMVLNNSGIDTGVYDNVKIYENDGALNPDDDILPRGETSVSGNVVLNTEGYFVFSGEWLITQDDYDAGKDFLIEATPNEFYFVANNIRSPYLEIVSRDESVAFCGDFDEEALCNSCSNSLDCSAAYNSANDISKSEFNAGCGEVLPENNNYKTNCFCQWNAVDNKCDGGVSYVSTLDRTVAPHCKNDVSDEDETGLDCGGSDCGDCVNGSAVSHCKNDVSDEDETGLDCGGSDCGDCSYSISFPKVGSCNYESSGEDDCEDNFLEYSWTGEFVWGADNGFSSTDNVFSDNPDDYVLVEGTYYYDPVGLSSSCVGGTNVIPCPAQIQLPFFGFFGIVGSLVLIALIYLALIFRDEKR